MADWPPPRGVMPGRPIYTAGIDVSHWQGKPDWPTVKAAGIAFAFIKATQGATYVDPQFAANWAGAKAAGILRGAYHFFKRDIDVRKQIDHFQSTLPFDSDLPPALDLEDGPMDTAELADAIIFLETMELSEKRIPILYVNRSTADKITDERFARYPLWLAEYTSLEPGKVGIFDAQWTFWQHTDKGTVAGIAGPCDLDWFRGTVEELADVGKLVT